MRRVPITDESGAAVRSPEEINANYVFKYNLISLFLLVTISLLSYLITKSLSLNLVGALASNNILYLGRIINNINETPLIEEDKLNVAAAVTMVFSIAVINLLVQIIAVIKTYRVNMNARSGIKVAAYLILVALVGLGIPLVPFGHSAAGFNIKVNDPAGVMAAKISLLITLGCHVARSAFSVALYRRL